MTMIGSYPVREWEGESEGGKRRGQGCEGGRGRRKSGREGDRVGEKGEEKKS